MENKNTNKPASNIQSINQQLLHNIWPFCIIAAILLISSYVSMSALSAVRSYAYAQNDWSKSHIEAIFLLNHYAKTHEEEDFQQFLIELDISRQNNAARLAMQKSKPDIQQAKTAFIKAKNHPDDVAGMVTFFLYFQHTHFMQSSIAYWVQGDQMIARVLQLAKQLNQHINSHDANPETINRLLAQVNQINIELTPVEAAFEETVGHASRKAQLFIAIFMTSITTLLMALGIYLTRRIVLKDMRLMNIIRVNEERLKFALDGAHDGVWDLNLITKEVTYSSQWREMLGYNDGDLVADYAGWMSMVHPDDLLNVSNALQDYVQGKSDRYALEYRVLCKNGDYKWVLTRGKIVSFTNQGKAERMVGTHTDIDALKKIEAALIVSDSNQRALLEAMVDGVFVAQDYRFVFSNPVLPKMLGYTEAEFINIPFEKVIAPLYLDVWNKRFTMRIEHGKEPEHDYQVEFLVKGGQKTIWVDLHASRVEFLGKRSVLGIVRDISSQKAAEDLIWQQANFDSLTGLPNRRMFKDRLELEIKKLERTGMSLAVMFLDLDHFKVVNDTMGHNKGDDLLKAAALRIETCIRETDTVARLGDDEFVILLSEMDGLTNSERVAENILSQLTKPFELGGEPIYISASIGITFYPSDAINFDDLLKNADQAMYVAKAEGRNRCSYFTPSMQADAQYRMRLANDLRHAVERNEIKLLYQPIVDIKSKIVHKAEALIRWHHPQLGLISPSQFIPIAEDTGLIYELGDWVFNESLKQVKKWRKNLHADFQISINKSPIQFKNPNFTWIDQLEKRGVPGGSITVEITESSLLGASDTVAKKLLKFKQAGIQVAIDDFGTGYSSLSYLKKYDVDYIKIDQSFVKNMTANSSDMGLCEAIILMAHKLNMRVIAEGVETQEQYDLLAKADCDFAQGYLLSKPVMPDAFEALWQLRAA